MRILVLSFYYHPDLSAGSFRTTALVTALRERLPAGSRIDVVTTQPNRYKTFPGKVTEVEASEGLEVRRIAVSAHTSDMIGQSRAFVRYAVQAAKYVAKRDYDLVFATSSRLMTASLGASIARTKGIPLYLDIRDIFVDTIKDVLPPALAWPARIAFTMIEAWTMRRADRINIVSKGFEDYFRERYGSRSLAYFTNGIDDEFLTPLSSATASGRSATDKRTMVLYAGNIGDGQALHKILPTLARQLRDSARFVVIGDGGRRAALEASVLGMDNVELRPPVSRKQLLEAYRDADVLFLHLGSHPAFEKVLPSKVFEYASLGKPMLAGVAGYAARFIREEISNAAVFSPCDAAGAAAGLASLKLGESARRGFVAKYARAHIARAMADDVVSQVRCAE